MERYFTHENTEGFTADELDAMNQVHEQAMSGVDPQDEYYQDMAQSEGEKLLSRFHGETL